MASQKPSVPIHGNYHGYYTKRPFLQDQRLEILPPSLLRAARVLDVGCNEGWVTCEIAQAWGAKKVVGVDIDDSLIRTAWKRRRSVWSMQAPVWDDKDKLAEEVTEDAASRAHGKKRKRTVLPPDDDARAVQADYFPASCEHMFGPLPIPSRPNAEEFPHNVVFRTADWVTSPVPEDADGYDVVLAFSISKWIHLNSGDEGIMRFFRRVHSVLRVGGTFVLEPQEWDTYSKAKRMDPRLKDNASQLKLRPNDFEKALREIGFGPAQHLGVAGEGGFKRPVDLYVKDK